MSTTPLPDLERELVAAARRLDAAAPRRRWWLHGWALIAVVFTTAGVGVSAAQVAGLDPFAYLTGNMSTAYPKMAPTVSIAVGDDAREPRWQARAYVTKIGQVCITGGRADTRTNPSAKPTDANLNNPPTSGTTCTNSEEAAELLVDPDVRGSTFASGIATAGQRRTPQRVRKSRRRLTGKTPLLPVGGLTRPTRYLVYALAVDGAPEPRVRWGDAGAVTPMRRSAETMTVKVDRSPDGLSAAGQAKVASYPAELTLRLWAAEIPVPADPRPTAKGSFGFFPQVIGPEVPRPGDDAIVELLPVDDMIRRVEDAERRGMKRFSHITRFEKPVPGPTTRAVKWVAALARPRRAADAIPEREIDDLMRRQRIQPAASRRPTSAGDDLGPSWIVPGGGPVFLPDRQANDALCIVGPPVLEGCKQGTRRWRRPLVEAVVCSHNLDPKDSVVWAFTPPGAATVDVVGPGAARLRLPARELITLRRPQGERIRTLIWRWRSGKVMPVRVPWPTERNQRCGFGKDQWSNLRRDSEGSSASGRGRPGTPYRRER